MILADIIGFLGWWLPNNKDFFLLGKWCPLFYEAADRNVKTNNLRNIFRCEKYNFLNCSGNNKKFTISFCSQSLHLTFWLFSKLRLISASWGPRLRNKLVSFFRKLGWEGDRFCKVSGASKPFDKIRILII